MKKVFLFVLISVFFACNSENAPDCLQTSGSIVTREVEAPFFTSILVNEHITLIVKQAAEQSVTIETGENLINEVTAKVENGRLVLTDANNCNYFRDYGITKVYVAAPNITQIRSSTQFDVVSDGVLNYPQLALVSESFSGDFQSVGNFNLEVNCETLNVDFNNLSNARIKGTTQTLNVRFFAGNSRFEGQGLLAGTVNVFHRSSNDIIVNPQQVLKGDIFSTGNVVSVSRPPTVQVTEHYRGRLVFED